MNSKFIIFIKVLLASLICHTFAKNCPKPCPKEESMPWSYNSKLPNGPSNWDKQYPKCNGKMQSPINIGTKVILEKKLQKLEMVDYNIPITDGTMENIGYTARVTPTDGNDRFMIINGTAYFLQFLEFHWSDNEEKRTACHSVDDEHYVFEMQLVHTTDEDEGSTAMISVLFKSSTKNNPALDPIVDLLNQVSYKNDEVDLRSDINLMDFMDEEPSYYQYVGSQIVPPCEEGIIWNVCKKTTFIGKRQMRDFRQLSFVEKDSGDDASGCRIFNNVRPLQSLYERKVESSE